MNSTARVDPESRLRRGLVGLAVVGGATSALGQPPISATNEGAKSMTSSASLSARHVAIGPIAAAAAVGDLAKLAPALDRGLDAGLSINDIKEVLVQLYAYAGFPRSLNALTAFMKVLEGRRERGISDPEGALPGPVPSPGQILEVGTANQTKLSGAPVRGPLFEFAPAIDQYLKAHLFGDIFVRDNLDWQSRELATVAALSAMTGVDSQLLSHIRISMNVGLSAEQLSQFASELSSRGEPEAGRRAQSALERHLASAKR